MKDQETVQQCIELRSRGISFARIADRLGVAKSTLVAWSRQRQHLIQNLRTIAFLLSLAELQLTQNAITVFKTSGA